eukprot:7375820-Prymnesium_polylepis.1
MPHAEFAPVCRTNVSDGSNICPAANHMLKSCVTTCSQRGESVDCLLGGSARPGGASGEWQLDGGYMYALDLRLAAALAALFNGSTVVEFGAGEGCYTERLRAAGVAVVG